MGKDNYVWKRDDYVYICWERYGIICVEVGNKFRLFRGFVKGSFSF